MDFYEIYEELVQTMGETQARLLIKTLRQMYGELQQTVTKAEFADLKDVVRELAEAQKRTEQRVGELAEAQKRTEQRLEELAQAQRRTEERLELLSARIDSLAQRMEELAEAQKLTEARLDALAQRVDALTQRVDDLTQRLDALTQRVHDLTQRLDALTQRVDDLTQRLDALTQRVDDLTQRLDALTQRVDSLTQRMEELAEAQRRTEQRLEELAQAQRRTEERLDALSERLEGISHSVGYSLENAAYKGLPAILAAQGITLKGRLVRRYVGAYQLNIYGEGERAGQLLTLVGECKVRPSRKEVDRFLKLVERLVEEGELANPYLIFVAHDFPPPLEHYLAERGILVVWSYEL